MKKGVGICPVCKGEDLKYHAVQLETDSICYPFTCNDCGHDGKEWYTLEYYGSE
jgi:C4-type Zn-finger protein